MSARRTLLALGLTGFFLGLSAPADAAPKPVGFLICQPGGPKLAPEQKKVLDQLFRYLEVQTKPKAPGGISGVYTNTWEDCERELKKNPSIIFPTLPIYLELNRTLGLTPIAQLRINNRVRDHFYVMVKKDSDLTLEGLKGKTVSGTHLGCKEFTAEVALGGKLTLDQITLKPEQLGLRAIRNVMRGKAEAVILDGFQYRNLKGTRYEKKLKPIYVSKELPTPPVAVVKGMLSPDYVTSLQHALVSMDKNPEGQSVLNLFRIEGFAAPEPQSYGQLEARLAPKK